MLKRKVMLYAAIVIAFAACSKEDMTSISMVNASSSQNAELAEGTAFGLIEEKTSASQTTVSFVSQVEGHLDMGANKMARVAIFLAETTRSSTADLFLTHGYHVQINTNWKNGTNGYRSFPAAGDTNLLKSQAEAFFQYYAPYKDQIPLVVVENEWDYQASMSGASIPDYLVELQIITTIGHKYGFKIGDGGITSGALQRWLYTQLPASEQPAYKTRYFVGDKQSDFPALMNIVNTYIAGAKNIDFDYSNTHWYNTSVSNGGFGKASQIFMQACNKQLRACNEFGIRTNDMELFKATLNEIRGNSDFAVAYSGSNKAGKAIMLTDSMFVEL